MTSDSQPSTRVKIFVSVVTIVAVVSAAYLYLIRSETPSARGTLPVVDDLQQKSLAELRREPHVAFRHMAPGPDYGRLAFTPLANRASRVTT